MIYLTDEITSLVFQWPSLMVTDLHQQNEAGQNEKSVSDLFGITGELYLRNCKYKEEHKHHFAWKYSRINN